MAEIIKISELPSQTVFADDDLFATVDTSVAETKKAQLSNIKTYMQGDLNTRLTTAEGEIDTAQTDINNAESVIGNETDTYSTSSTYDLGSLVIYNSLLYKCTTAITVAEAWTIAHWTQVNLVNVSSGLKGKILWTNPNPSNEFNKQTINIDLTDYDIIEIYYKPWNAGDNITSSKFIKGMPAILMGTFAYSDSNVHISSRKTGFISDTGIYFEDARRITNVVNASTQPSNNESVPIYIIGYKTGLFN